MVIETNTWLSLALLVNTLLLFVNMVVLMGIQKDRSKINRMIIALVENRKRR